MRNFDLPDDAIISFSVSFKYVSIIHLLLDNGSKAHDELIMPGGCVLA